VILFLSFEELAALRGGTERVLAAHATHSGHGIAAPPQVIAELELLAHSLNGDLPIATLEQQGRTRAAVAHLLDDTRRHMHEAILEQHPAAESAIASYFDYAYILGVLTSLDRMHDEMVAIIRMTTGEEPDIDTARRFSFPD
jgi:hypothetical protein